MKTYTYEIALDEPMYPRHLADFLTTIRGYFSRHLISVTDQQRSDHVYGATYVQREAPVAESLTYRQMLDYYQQAYAEATSTPQKDAYAHIVTLLSQEWVPGNMGLLAAYLREFLRTLEDFEERCERVGTFAEEVVNIAHSAPFVYD